MSPVHLAARTDRSSPGPQADLSPAQQGLLARENLGRAELQFSVRKCMVGGTPVFSLRREVSGSGPLGISASSQPLLSSLSSYYPSDNGEHPETLEKHDTPPPSFTTPAPMAQGCAFF